MHHNVVVKKYAVMMEMEVNKMFGQRVAIMHVGGNYIKGIKGVTPILDKK